MYRSEEEVDALLKEMVARTKGKYITQGVSFNKTCPKSMSLLKQALLESASFSGLIKQLLVERYSTKKIQTKTENNINTTDISNDEIDEFDELDELDDLTDEGGSNIPTQNKNVTSWF